MRWFRSLTVREQVLVGLGMPIAIVALAINYLWLPLGAARDAAISDIAAYRLVADTARLAADAGDQFIQPIPVSASMPLATRITRSADAASLRLRRVEPDGTGIRVTLDDAPFAQVLLWLAELEQTDRVTVAAIEMDRRPAPGIVTSRILLEDLK